MSWESGSILSLRRGGCGGGGGGGGGWVFQWDADDRLVITVS